MTPIISRRTHLRAGKIWIDDALGGTARCSLSALRQRGIAAFDVAALYVVDLQADRVVRIIRLGASRRCRQNRHARQNRQSRNAHQSLLEAVPSIVPAVIASEAKQSICGVKEEWIASSLRSSQ